MRRPCCVHEGALRPLGLHAEPKSHVQAAAAITAGGQGWPISLRRYVERSFAQKIPDEKKGALNVALKQIISDAQAPSLKPVMLHDVPF